MNNDTGKESDGTATEISPEILSKNTVLIAGGEPVGLMLATVLAHFGVKSVILERNDTTTRWPKMDLTNARSMELFRKLGLADELRKQGVPSHLPYTVLFTTGLGAPAPFAKWEHNSVDEYRIKIAAKNDGTMPLEPWQRLSQAIFERWLKAICDKNPLIDVRFSCKVEGVEDLGDGVLATVTNLSTKAQYRIVSQYMVGCDGGSSRVRRSLGIPLEGGPVPMYMLLVHFRSRDLTRLHAHGRFWHVFVHGEDGMSAGCIAQNEKDVLTIHLVLPMDQDSDSISSEEAVYRALGGLQGLYQIKIDEVLVWSTFRPNIAISGRYSGCNGHVYLAGDAAHQNIPTGGYGTNMGLADAFELGWKLAAVVNGYAQPNILQTYEQERRPAALASIERSGVHMRVHMEVPKLAEGKVRELDADGIMLRKVLQEYYHAHNGESTDLGIEMGYRYESNIIIPDGTEAPAWKPSTYVPTTHPGHRALHVFLRDGTSIIDEFGPHYTLVEFCEGDDHGAHHLAVAAWRGKVPLKHLKLTEERNAHNIYQRNMVLVRPDGHVAWRANQIQDEHIAEDIIATISGRKNNAGLSQAGAASMAASAAIPFTSTVGINTQIDEFKLEKMGDFQS